MAIQNLRTGEMTHTGRVVGLNSNHIYTGTEKNDTVFYAVVLKEDGSYEDIAIGSYHNGVTEFFAVAVLDAADKDIIAYDDKYEARRIEERERVRVSEM